MASETKEGDRLLVYVLTSGNGWIVDARSSYDQQVNAVAKEIAGCRSRGLPSPQEMVPTGELTSQELAEQHAQRHFSDKHDEWFILPDTRTDQTGRLVTAEGLKRMRTAKCREDGGIDWWVSGRLVKTQLPCGLIVDFETQRTTRPERYDLSWEEIRARVRGGKMN